MKLPDGTFVDESNIWTEEKVAYELFQTIIYFEDFNFLADSKKFDALDEVEKEDMGVKLIMNSGLLTDEKVEEFIKAWTSIAEEDGVGSDSWSDNWNSEVEALVDGPFGDVYNHLKAELEKEFSDGVEVKDAEAEEIQEIKAKLEKVVKKMVFAFKGNQFKVQQLIDKL